MKVKWAVEGTATRMRIGELAQRTGLAPRMLRYYEEQGLLTPGRRANGYRDYATADLHQAETIRDLSRAGVPTRFIKIVLDRRSGRTGWTDACDDILAGLVRDQITELDAKIGCLATSRDALTRFLDDSGRGAEASPGGSGSLSRGPG